MAFLSLCTVSFRNLTDININTSVKDIFLVGENGQGKTNFLEALYFCSYASSFRGVRDGELVRSGESDFSAMAVLGSLLDPPGELLQPVKRNLPVQIIVKVEKLKKTILLEGKKISDRKYLLEAVPTVAFCHEDMEFVSGSQERRRWFFDQTQSLYDPVYLDDLRKYRHVLKTRNAVLKNIRAGGDNNKTAGLLDALDPQLADYGIRLMEKRIIAADKFSAVFSLLYREVSGITGVTVSYDPSWKYIPKEETIISRLAGRRAADVAQGVTLSGPHRDRYLFLRDGTAEFSGNASTGQRRLLALLLRVSQSRCFSDQTGKTPVLLLDDVLLELDGEKRRRFLSVMPDYEQAFFTFLPEEPYKSYIKPDTLVYYVKRGQINT